MYIKFDILTKKSQRGARRPTQKADSASGALGRLGTKTDASSYGCALDCTKAKCDRRESDPRPT